MGLLLQPGTCCGCSSTTKICVTVCSGLSAYGYTIELYSGSSEVDSCVTDSTGCCTFTETGTYTVKVYNPEGTLISTSTHTLSGTTITIAATDPAVVCCGGYVIPVTMSLTDATGTVPLVYSSTVGGSSFWYACVQPIRTCYNYSGVACALVSSSQAMTVCYLFACQPSSSPKFGLTRTWAWNYWPIAPTAVWMNGSWATCSPGSPCIVAGGSPCSNNTDSSASRATPSSSAPFAISFTPVPAGGNATSDPIGGTVAIS